LPDELAAGVKDGSFRALPARRCSSRSPAGRTSKGRGRFAVGGPVVQAATKLAIEPVFDADFLPCSFRSRPRRAAHDALEVR
jgi:hypothetical protein